MSNTNLGIAICCIPKCSSIILPSDVGTIKGVFWMMNFLAILEKPNYK